jgi:cobaltochelatase CobS
MNRREPNTKPQGKDMTPEEIKLETGKDRGHLFVTSGNRGLVRKWLVAQGVKASYAYRLSNFDLAKVYNDTGGALLRSHVTASQIETDEPTPMTIVEPPVSMTIAPTLADGTPITTAAVAARATDQLQALQALRTLFGTAAVDADMVRKIMRDELPSLIPVQRVELVTDGVVKNLGTAPRHKVFARALRAVSAGLHLALVGPAGSGKTTLGEQIAQALAKQFYITGAISGQHEVLGFNDAYGKYQTTPFRQAYECGGLLLWDEFDASDACASLILNSALANGVMTFPDRPEPVKKHPDFRIIVAANTFGSGADRLYVGRNQMDAATLDRLCFLVMDYDEALERQLCANDKWCQRVQALRHAAEVEKARMVISPRASFNGATLLASGEQWGDVEDMVIWKGTDVELRRRIEARTK